MGITFNHGNFLARYGTRSRQGGVGSKKSSFVDSAIGNANDARERVNQMYSSSNIHTPTPNSNLGFLNAPKNNNHQQPYKLTSTGRGKTPHQKPGSPKRRKHSGGKRSHSRPRSSKHSGGGKSSNFQARFFDPKQFVNGYNMA